MKSERQCDECKTASAVVVLNRRWLCLNCFRPELDKQVAAGKLSAKEQLLSALTLPCI